MYDRGAGFASGYRHDIGIDRILWECDYPHADTVWPRSQESVAGLFAEAGVSSEEGAAIAHGNAEKVFGWQMASPPSKRG